VIFGPPCVIWTAGKLCGALATIVLSTQRKPINRLILTPGRRLRRNAKWPISSQTRRVSRHFHAFPFPSPHPRADSVTKCSLGMYVPLPEPWNRLGSGSTPQNSWTRVVLDELKVIHSTDWPAYTLDVQTFVSTLQVACWARISRLDRLCTLLTMLCSTQQNHLVSFRRRLSSQGSDWLTTLQKE